MAQPLPSQNMGIPMHNSLRRPMPTGRAVIPQQGIPVNSMQPMGRNMHTMFQTPAGANPIQPENWRTEFRDRVRRGGIAGAMGSFGELINNARQRLGGGGGQAAAATPHRTTSRFMKKGGSVDKLKKLKKPIKKKSLKKADRVKKPAFKEGGAVERFLSKYPDYNPES